MAVLTQKKPEVVQSPIEQTDLPVVTAPEYRGSTVDTRYDNHRSLLTHVEGSSWIVRYYQQYLGLDDEPGSQELFKDAVHQQYKLIDRLELKVTGALSPSQDTTNKEFEVGGEATLYPPVIPNKGDMFLADVGDGREGVFAIVETTRLSILKDTCYSIRYTLIDYATEQRRVDLNSKVILETHFNKKLLQHGVDPIVVSDDYNRYLSLESYREKLVGQYFGEFFNKSISSLGVPGQKLITYDGFVVTAIKSFMESDDHPLLRKIKVYTLDIMNVKPPITIWDCLLRVSLDLLPIANEKLGVIDSRYFGGVAQFQGVYFSNVKDIVYPVDKDLANIDFKQLLKTDYGVRDIRHQFEHTSLGSILNLNKPTGTGIDALRPIKSVIEDEYYLFSEAFYTNNKTAMSQLEYLTMEVLEGRPINLKVLSNLCDQTYRWTLLDRFYYTPVLLILIKMSLRGL